MADISKIKINDAEYDIKDAELRHMMNILLGIEKPDVVENDNE